MISVGLLILRLGLGVMFTAHGLQMAFGMFRGPGLEGFSKMLGGLGINPALTWAYIAAYSALIGGLCLILGILPKAASAILIIFMLVAAIKVHLSKGFFLVDGGYEYNLVVICALLVILLVGAGKYSIFNKF